MRKLLIATLFISVAGMGQSITDTIGFMHYNVLNYRNITTYCTANNNNPTTKDGYMKTIVGHLLPDIITVNEMAGDGGTAAKRLLDNALNKDGRNYYKQCNYAANSSLCNMLYYNRNKFALYAQDKIERAPNNSFLVRLIDVYTLYYRDQSELDAGDTTFLTIYVTHLKAGSTSSDKVERKEMADAIMAYHEDNYGTSNYFIAGDFNIQSSDETSYTALVNNANTNIRFYDPIERSGEWNKDSKFAKIHTQSTQSSSNGCASSGGMDDRFDFVLCGKEVIDNTNGVGYIPGTYEAVGNDGKHFDSNIKSPANNSVPSNVLTALSGMSDHLPVYLKIGIGRTTASVNDYKIENYLIINNPVNNLLYWKLQTPANGFLELRDVQGKLMINQVVSSNQSWIQNDVSNLSRGTYYAAFTSDNGQVVRRKIVKM